MIRSKRKSTRVCSLLTLLGFLQTAVAIPSGKLEPLSHVEHDYFFDGERKLEDYYAGQNEDEYAYNGGYNSAKKYGNGYDQYAAAAQGEPEPQQSQSSGGKAYAQKTKYNSNYGPYGVNFFADSESTYYDGYQQAWRYLGHFVKCGAPSSRYDEDADKSHHSDDEERYRGNNWCQRYLVWAAYVDLNYEGGGIGEYYYQDPYTSEWDYTACKTHGSSSGRCAPMDCHDPDTETWTLMGVYKEAEYFGNDAFFEQLFKHEGYCVWNDEDTYEFMSETRQEAWPEGCVQTNKYLTDSSGSKAYLYIDLKPTYNGNMTYGIYWDDVCKYEYRGSAVSVESLAKSMGLLYGKYLNAWNDALEVYKVCQPCMAYNIAQTSSSYSSSSYYNGYYYGNNNNNNNNGRSDDPNEGYFQCDDDADYTNVNQCMKFRSHAQLEVCTWEDLAIATEQGGILDINIGGKIYGTEKMSYAEQQYKEQLLRAKEAEEERQYKALLATVPDPRPMQKAGQASVVLGPLALLISIYLVRRRRRKAWEELQREIHDYDIDESKGAAGVFTIDDREEKEQIKKSLSEPLATKESADEGVLQQPADPTSENEGGVMA